MSEPDDRLQESETWLDRRLDKADEEIWISLLILTIGGLGSLLGDVLPPTILGGVAAALLCVSIISLRRVRLLKRRIALLRRAPALPVLAQIAPLPDAIPPDAMQISPLGHTLLCKMYDNWEEKEEWMPHELRSRLRSPLDPLIEVEMSLDELVSLGFAGKNADDPDHLWLRGEPEPGSYYIEEPGKRYVRSLKGQR